MTIDEAVANAARVLEAAEQAPTPRSQELNEVANSWLRIAEFLAAHRRV
jgi:hypothetical protein